MPSQVLINNLKDWAYWAGSNQFEIKKMCGYGKSPSQILIDRAKQFDIEVTYNRSRADYLDQVLMIKIDRVITNKLTATQRKVIQAEHIERFKYIKQAAKWVGINRNWYRITLERAYNILEYELNM